MANSSFMVDCSIIMGFCTYLMVLLSFESFKLDMML